MSKPTVHRIILDTYLAVIKNSVGSRMFRNFYAEVGGTKTDVMRNGKLSCALYVSSVLVLFNLIQRIHGTVDATVADLERSGWKKISTPRVGAVILWGSDIVSKGGTGHRHIGFCIGKNSAISNSSSKGFPVKHSLECVERGKVRTIEHLYWNAKLAERSQ